MANCYPQVLLERFQSKASKAEAIPRPIQDRISELLSDARNALASGVSLILFPSDIPSEDASFSPVYQATGDSHEFATVETLDHLKGFFDAETGLNVKNESLCRLVRSCIIPG